MIGVINEFVGINAAKIAFPTLCQNTKVVEYSTESCFASPNNNRLGSTPDGIAYDSQGTAACVIEVKCLKWHNHVLPPSSFPPESGRNEVQNRCLKTLAQLHLHMFHFHHL